MPPSTRIYDLQEAREKIRAYCVYRERSQHEVRQKLRSYGLQSATTEELITELIQENFLNEERFARAYVRGKFRMKKWGRRKIEQGLQQHQLSQYVWKKALEELDAQEYGETLRQILLDKWRHTRDPDTFKRRGKVAAYAIRKGYEPKLVWEELREWEE